MSGTELVTTQPQQQLAPFGGGRALSASVNAGAVTVESDRAVAEAQGQLILAKKFPRDLTSAHAELMLACKSPSFASIAFYSKPQGGKMVTGPSIRMAEEIARVVGNFQYGHRELGRDSKKSEVEVYAWDMEKNNYNKRQLTVMHVRDTKEGPKPLRDQTDVDQKINNLASKQVRGLILAMMPKWLVEDAVQECKKTLAGTNDEPLSVRVRKMTQAFAKYGVTPEHLEKRLGHKLDSVLLDELVEMTGIFNALKEGEPASEYFGEQEAEAITAASVDAVKQAAANGAAAAAATPKAARTPKATPAPTPATTPAPAPAAEPPAESQPEVTKSQAVQKESTTVKDQAPADPVAETPQASAQTDTADEGDIF